MITTINIVPRHSCIYARSNFVKRSSKKKNTLLDYALFPLCRHESILKGKERKTLFLRQTLKASTQYVSRWSFLSFFSSQQEKKFMLSEMFILQTFKIKYWFYSLLLSLPLCLSSSNDKKGDFSLRRSRWEPQNNNRRNSSPSTFISSRLRIVKPIKHSSLLWSDSFALNLRVSRTLKRGST